MLFFNFLCLFYLMVLINSHTISKNIAYDDTIDDIVDSIHDFDYRREYRPKHDRLHRYYRKEEKEDVRKSKERAGQKIQSTAAKLVSDSTEISKLTRTVKPTLKSTKHLGFWHKFRNKAKEKKTKALKNDEVYKRMVEPRSYHKQYLQSHLGSGGFKYDDTAFKGRRMPSIQRNRQTDIDKRKREVVNVTTTAKSITLRSSIFTPLSSKSRPFKLTSIKTYEPLNSTALTALTTKINDLKKEYSFKLKSSSFPAITTQNVMNNISSIASSMVSTPPTTTDVDFLGTAQIEALLNDIKVKAVQMVAEQSPAITDIITNTVTEITFEADPILTHLSTPGYALSTFISIDSDSSYSKITASQFTGSNPNDTVVIANTEPTHQITVRSINEDVITIAQTIEDMLQKELKKVYKKVKGKISNQLNQEVDHAKTTMRKESDKIIKKITHTGKGHKESVTTQMTTPKMKARQSSKKHKGSTLKQVRRSPKHGNERPKIKTSSVSTPSTFDDYVMLTLFEQILAKTHEDNVMKMLTTSNFEPKHHEHFRLLKRTPTTARPSVEQNVQKVYDEIILPDDLLDYGSKTANAYSMSTSTESEAEDTSYEGLSNKIAYNDFVNGYKHYLKFQKEQGNQNFSNLVRYQAHRHHSVDDIGKFILNKIPQLPRKRLKRFFDDDIMEDQDISTKSDDSWFKKHFYLFIDNGPPRKFHTSQTVELKSPITDSDTGGTENPAITLRAKSKGFNENEEGLGESNSSNQDSIESSLEQLSKVLDDRKNKEFTSIIPRQFNRFNTEEKEEEDARNKANNPENSIFRSLGSIGLVDKLFGGKGRRTPKHNAKLDKESTEILSDVNREKRNTKNIEDSLYTSQGKNLRSTVPSSIETSNKNYGYVDVNLIPRPTAIVKLRENKPKKGKFKKFFNKFHFRKSKKRKETNKVKRNKREYRVQRFNPLKKLKDMFKVKQQEKPAQSIEIPDYEVMTSHIDTFKPVKYNKVMSIDEIKGQIPNITEEMAHFHHHEALKSDEKPVSNEMPILSPISPEEAYDLASEATTQKFSGLTTTTKATTKKPPKLTPNLKHSGTLKPLHESNVDAPKITYDPSTNKFEINFEGTPSFEATQSFGGTPSLDDIRNEIDSLHLKLSSPEDYPTSTKSSTHSSTLSTTRYSNNFSAKKIFVPLHLQTAQMTRINAKADPKDIKIQTKLTRIAKFPLSHFAHDHSVKIDPVIERPQMYEHKNRDGSCENILIGVRPEKRIRKKSLNTYVPTGPRFPIDGMNDFSKTEGYNKPYPDYFNDLLMWHGDLLNTDRLTSPQWETILRGIQDPEVSTLSMIDMQREIMNMKEYLKIDEFIKGSTPLMKFTAKPLRNVKKEKLKDKIRKNIKSAPKNIIKTVAMKDDTIAQGNDIVIQGEAKYFHVIKQPETESLKYVKAADLLNDLNKIYFKSPGIKYNIDDKLRDMKRNGEFWIDNMEPKNKNTKEQDSSSVLFLDTTLLAYDDGPDFLDRPKHKKMSKNSLVTSKPHKNQVSAKPVAKTNPSPSQYFSTPLPMRMNDFERFLKENQLDVQSVTSPLIGMPQFVLNKMPGKNNALNKMPTMNIQNKNEYHPKTVKPAITDKVSSKTTTAFVTMNPMILFRTGSKMIDENNSLDQTTEINKYDQYKNINDKRMKRFIELRNERFFTFEPFCKKSRVGKVKKKIKLFDKKTQQEPPVTSKLTDLRYTVIGPQNEDDDNMKKEVELTIINMNDIEQGEPTYQLTTDNPKQITTRSKGSGKFDAKAKTSKEADETTSCPHRIHNNLLYNHKHKDKNGKTSKPVTETVLNLENSVVMDDISTTTFHPMINHELFRHLHAKNPPKRVRVSSHSYKYDIIYNNEPKRFSKNSNRAHKNGHNRFTPVPRTTRYYDDDYSKSPFNSENHEIVKIVKAVEAVDSYTRPNVIIHIDLPTYFKPDTGPTERIAISAPKSTWNEFIMKYLSGIALIELLNKFGILNEKSKFFDDKSNMVDGVDKAVNANKVFSIAEHYGVEKEVKWQTKARRSRQANFHQSGTTKSIDSYEGLETMVPNWREKRRLKLFSNIKGKLKTLLTKKSKPTSASPKTRTPKEEDTTKTKISTFDDHHAREKKDEIKGDGISTIDNDFNIDYDFDVDRIVQRATTSADIMQLLIAKINDKQKPKNEKQINIDTDIPDLSSTTIDEATPKLDENITSTSYSHFNTPTPPITTTAKNTPLTTKPSTAQPKFKLHHGSNEEVYFEPSLYDNKIYYERTSMVPKSSIKNVNKQAVKAKDRPKLNNNPVETKLEKRDIQPAGKFTAKDVAALEVIVDLVKNTVNYEERVALQDFTESYYQTHPAEVTTIPALRPTQGPNSIQVHIAIPYNLQVDKKRSLDTLNVRRVFAAKMFSPVDLEYQVQSFEDSKQTTPTLSVQDDFMTPKMYLLIDANGSWAKGNFPLKPIKGNIDLSKVRVRQATTTKAFATQKAETTSGKSIGRVTLSKDFVAAVNKHLVQLYQNLTAIQEATTNNHVRVREAKVFERPNKVVDAIRGYRRHINWHTVKKFFGHDRVCNCKCKANRTMCRACAASDAVISELIFEFDNLAKYMNDHCKEIQTFFWMNPSGGKKLRDTVHKVDQTLHNYFKRVKGKCQGRTCKTFSTCIDKRSFVKQKKIPKKYIGEPLIMDLDRLAYDIDTSSKLGICYTDKLVEEGIVLMNTIGNCIKNVSKRDKAYSTTAFTKTAVGLTATKKQMIKNIYSLDNINVNIICKPESRVAIASSTEKMFFLKPHLPQLVSTGLNIIPNSNIYDYDNDEAQFKKRKSFRNFFANRKLGKYKMNHLFTYYVTKDPDATTPIKMFKKRQIANQIDNSLVSDTGGTFWKVYLKGNTLPQEVINANDITRTELAISNTNDESTRYETSGAKTSISQITERILRTTPSAYSEKHVYQRNINTTDYSSIDTLSYNINELFKIFHNLTDLKEIENMSTQTFEPSEKHTKIKPKHSKTKTTKIFKIIKEKLHFKHKSATKSKSKPKITHMSPPNDTKLDDDGIVASSDSPLSSKTSTEVPNTSAMTTEKATTAKITKTTSTPKILKSTTNKEESSETSHKDGDITTSESTQETTSVAQTSSSNVNLTNTSIDESSKVTKKPVKGNFLSKLKMATIDLFHNNGKELQKSTSTTAESTEKRKSRSTNPATKTNKIFKPLTKADEGTNVITEATTNNNPTILIINEYDSDTESEVKSRSPENESSDDTENDNNEDTDPNSNSESGENFRSLLLSILNYEAKKLSSEWKRVKKGGNFSVANNPDIIKSKRGMFSLYISTESTLNTKKYENDYDILQTLKDLELPTPEGLETEKKGTGLLRKIANKFGVMVVPNSQSKKPKATSTKPRASRPIPKKHQSSTRKLKHPSKGIHKDAKSKSTPKKLNPKYTTIHSPILTVSVNDYDEEASKAHAGQVCDIETTFKQIQQMLQELPRKDIQKFISNKTCDKYKTLPKYFLIDWSSKKRKKKAKNRPKSVEHTVRWDWIRNKRSLNDNEESDTANDEGRTKITNRESENSKLVVIGKKYIKINDLKRKNRATTKNLVRSSYKIVAAHKNLNTNEAINKNVPPSFVVEDSESFEPLERDRYGIYRSKKKRRKRDYNLNELETGLKNLPYGSKPNESYAMLGDSIILQCFTNKMNTRDDTKNFYWVTDRKDMMLYDNVVMDGPKLMIREIEAKNSGEYTCHKGTAAQRKTRLTVITLPTFKVVFTPIYSIDGRCTYDDLNAVQFLGPMMTREVCSNDQLCSMRIEEPVCLRDRVSSAPHLRMTVVTSIPPQELECSGRCRRDAHDWLALMVAGAAPDLASVGIIIRKDVQNKTFTPVVSSDEDDRRTIVTHTLRRIKDSVKHKDHGLNNSPDTVNVIASCPAGFYLIADQKICAACPAGSWSQDGDNACAVESHAHINRINSRFRRCYWSWCPGCGWCAAGWGAACACAGAAALLHARGGRGGVTPVHTARPARTHSSRARPLSPSRVILAKFLRGSRSSAKVTDSQGAKFELWKEKHSPPPLPPIDFDL